MFATYLAHQAIQDQENIVDHLINPAEKRLARTLLLLANALEVGEPQPIPTRINQETLANMVGTTRSRISVFMNKFKREGHIHYDRNGQVTVHASLRSAVLNN
jgi:CRP-like cAMP-binding protein